MTRGQCAGAVLFILLFSPISGGHERINVDRDG